jgi:hypothetical protein
MEEEWTDTNAEIEQILTEFPGARGLADLISATSLEDYRQVAQQIDQKVRNARKESTSQPSPRTPKPKAEKSVQESVDSRDWSGFLAAQWRRQNEGNDRA